MSECNGCVRVPRVLMSLNWIYVCDFCSRKSTFLLFYCRNIFVNSYFLFFEKQRSRRPYLADNISLGNETYEERKWYALRSNGPLKERRGGGGVQITSFSFALYEGKGEAGGGVIASNWMRCLSAKSPDNMKDKQIVIVNLRQVKVKVRS